jgi:uncharacterized tellurite resistance protein B-like protein
MSNSGSDDSGFSPEGRTARAALRSRIDTGAQQLSSQISLADVVGTDDEEVLQSLELLGFNPDSARVLDVLPLVHVAWADGKIQDAERRAVLAVLEGRGVSRGSDAWLLIETLLEARPSETYLAQSLQLLRFLSRSGGTDPKNIVELCTRVAEASSSLFGLGAKVNAEERSLIARIASALGEGASEAVIGRVSVPPPAPASEKK